MIYTNFNQFINEMDDAMEDAVIRFDELLPYYVNNVMTNEIKKEIKNDNFENAKKHFKDWISGKLSKDKPDLAGVKEKDMFKAVNIKTNYFKEYV